MEDNPPIEPILITGAEARRLLSIGKTKYWELVRAGEIPLVQLGQRRLVDYRRLLALTSSGGAVEPD